MKQSYRNFFLASLLAVTLPAAAQVDIPYAVTAPCSPANAPSNLQRIVGNTLVNVGAITVGGTPVTVNGLGYDSGNLGRVFALGVNTASPGTVPLYQIATANGTATNLGNLVGPPVPETNANGTGQSLVFNLIGDGSNNRKYYVMAMTARVTPTFVINDATLYVGEIDLSVPVVSNTPIWRAATLDPAATAIVNAFLLQATAYFAGAGPLPQGGIQDWLFDPISGNLISYLGIEQRFLTISNISSAPSGVISVPSPQIPVTREVGGMYRDQMNNVYAVVSDFGAVYQIDRTTGNYTGNTFGLGVTCLRGDAATASAPPTLPVELVRFSATPNREGAVDLNWKTASESDVAYFRIERQCATDAGAAWKALETTSARNLSGGAEYQWRDRQPNAAALRYRLATVDLDGRVAYSATVAVRFTGDPKLGPLTPNPADDQCQLTFSTPLLTTGLLEVYNSLGIRVQQQPLTGATTLHTAHLPAGYYTVVATVGTSRQTQRLLVAR